MVDSIEYYNKNAIQFISNTVEVEFKETQNRFLKLLPEGGSILDYGCGSGRDTKYFLENHYDVDAMDGSQELCKLASEYTGITVQHKFFQQLDEEEIYDGVWACASILHVSYKKLAGILFKIAKALKSKGIAYISFKYGTFEGEKNGRYFTDMTEKKMRQLLNETGLFSIEQEWITGDARPGRGEEKWLNVILRRET